MITTDVGRSFSLGIGSGTPFRLIYNNGVLILFNVTIENGYVNSETSSGLYNNSFLSVTNCTFSGNQAVGSFGGGIYNGVEPTIGEIINSTFSDNLTATHGGGITNSGTIDSIANSTFAGNQLTQVVGSLGGGGIANVGSINTLFSNIIAANIATPYPDIFNAATIGTEGYNLFSSTPSFIPATTDIIQTDAASFLGPLQDNGGPTSTYAIALMPGSLAINNGFNIDSLLFDQ